MNSPILIGSLAGIAAALLFSAAAGGPVLLAVLLFLAAPLPAFLAGLGWGPVAVGLAAVTGAGVAFALSGAKLAAAYLIGIALPVGLLCWLAHLSRATPATDGSGQAAEWYPPGRLVAWAAVLAGVIATLLVLSVATDLEGLRTVARAAVERHSKEFQAFGQRALTQAEIDAIAAIFMRILPGASATLWLFMILANMWLAARILRTSGRLARPWPDLPAMALPAMAGSGLAVALVLSFTSGMIGLLAGGFASALLAAYALAGLAVLHTITRASGQRILLLTAAYLATFLLAPYGTLLVALLGLLDTIFRFRERHLAGGRGTPPTIT